MKKLISIVLLTLAFVPVTFAEQPSPSENCGVWLEKAHELGLPIMYCFSRQARGHQTFFGQLNLPCEGTACPVRTNDITSL